ncbi:Imm26 family immunity protein [Pseudoduganella danionis]|uniref:Imm26 family immunity protein n=1 Tax=Pseudoduganella danionis TaxID=1890295 RepID=UPI0035B434E3
MKPSYREGSWFAVPLLDGAYCWGMVARLAPASKIMLAYLFGPRLPQLLTVEQLDLFAPQQALRILRVGDMALASGHWPVLGQSQHWQAADWPMPQFLRRAHGLQRAWRVTYADADPSRTEREEAVPYDTPGLETDSLFGYGSVELLLTRLLADSVPQHGAAGGS